MERQETMVLTQADIGAIVDEIERRQIVHKCRYDIDPVEMRKLLGFVNTFYEGAIETRKTFRSMLIRMVVWGAIASILALIAEWLGLLRPMINVILRKGPTP